MPVVIILGILLVVGAGVTIAVVAKKTSTGNAGFNTAPRGPGDRVFPVPVTFSMAQRTGTATAVQATSSNPWDEKDPAKWKQVTIWHVADGQQYYLWGANLEYPWWQYAPGGIGSYPEDWQWNIRHVDISKLLFRCVVILGAFGFDPERIKNWANRLRPNVENVTYASIKDFVAFYNQLVYFYQNSRSPWFGLNENGGVEYRMIGYAVKGAWKRTLLTLLRYVASIVVDVFGSCGALTALNVVADIANYVEHTAGSEGMTYGELKQVAVDIGAGYGIAAAIFDLPI